MVPISGYSEVRVSDTDANASLLNYYKYKGVAEDIHSLFQNWATGS